MTLSANISEHAGTLHAAVNSGPAENLGSAENSDKTSDPAVHGAVDVSDPRALREAFAHHPSGVAALAATVDGEDQVLVASSFTVGVSLDPALVLFAARRPSATWSRLRRAPRIGISALSAGQHGLCRQLASRDHLQRWEGVAVERTGSGAIHIADCSLALECELYAEHPAGDHDVVILEVRSIRTSRHIDPLVFHGSRFRRIG